MTKNLIRSLLVSGLLFVVLIGLLMTYFAVVSDLPAQVYTRRQREYLSYNYQRSVAQQAPVLNVLKVEEQTVQAGEQIQAAILPGRDSWVRATLVARYEEQEGVSATIYDLDFQGKYQLVHASPTTSTVELFFPFPNNLETLHDVEFLVDGAEPPQVQFTTQGISWQTVLQAGEEHEIVISYKADGANSFTYGLPRNQRSNMDIVIRVVGLTGSQIPRAFLPYTANEVDGDGETFAWKYTGLIADRDIKLTLPTQLSFTQRLAQLQDEYFRTLAGLAPFLVSLFLISLFGVFHLSGVRLQLEGYLLIGCGLALFYPLFTFLSGMVGITLAGILALPLISSLLLVFLGLALGWRQVWWQVGSLLFIFLGVFSLGMLTPWRGLLLTSGGLLLIAIFMLLYARYRSTITESEPVPPSVEDDSALESALPAAEVVTEPEPVPTPDEPQPELAHRYCPYCAYELKEDYSFCPGCGHDTNQFRRCASCGHEQLVPAELEPVYCLNCGQLLS
jgi:hypothetical protein